MRRCILSTLSVALPAGCQHIRKELVPAAAYTASAQTSKFQVDSYSNFDIHLSVTAVSGTSPTMNVYVQKLLPDDSTWQDMASFAQVTATAAHRLSFISAGSSIAAVQTEALAAGSTVTTPVGGWMRLRWVIAGTSPSFTMEINGDFFA